MLKKIRELFGSSHKISIWKRSGKWKTAYRLQIGSKGIFNDLLKLGLAPRKSKRIRLPFIPQEYFSHFVRGYFDGDGNVTICTYKRKARNNKLTTILQSGFISGSKKFLGDLQIKLRKIGGLLGGTLYYSKGYRLFFSVKDSLLLYNFMYDNVNNNLFLQRKKKIFEKYFGIDR